MPLKINGDVVAGAVLNGQKIAGAVLNGESMWVSDDVNHLVMYSTNWDEYSASDNIEQQTNWSGAGGTTSSRRVQVFDAGGGDMQVRASGTGSNNTAWRTVETPNRATMYSRAVFPIIEQSTEAYCGVTFHHSDGNERNFAAVRWDGSNFIPYMGTLTGTFAGSVNVTHTGSPISAPSGDWVIEARATGLNSVAMWVNGTHVLDYADTSIYSGSLCGMMVWSAPNSACSHFDMGTILPPSTSVNRTVLHYTNWNEYSDGQVLYDLSDWYNNTAHSTRRVTVRNHGTYTRAVESAIQGSIGSQNKVAWTVHQPPRGSMYVRARFTQPFPDSGNTNAFCGVVFHCPLSSAQWPIFVIKDDTAGVRAYVGTCGGTTSGSISTIMVSGVLETPPGGEWEVEARATSATTVDCYVNGTFIATVETSGTDQHAGIVMWRDQGTWGIDWELGTWTP